MVNLLDIETLIKIRESCLKRACKNEDATYYPCRGCTLSYQPRESPHDHCLLFALTRELAKVPASWDIDKIRWYLNK